MMTFNDYIPIWKKQHRIAAYLSEKPMDNIDHNNLNLETLIIQKLDWLSYCENHEDVEKPDESFCDQLFQELIQQLVLDACGKHTIQIGDFVVLFNSVKIKQAEHYDIKLLECVNDLLLDSDLSFAEQYKIFITWVRSRVQFLATVQLGVPSAETGWIPAFYTSNRESFIRIRNTDYLAMKAMANYFLYLYDSCKTMDRLMMAGDIVKVHDFVVCFMHDVLSSSKINGYYEDEEKIKRIMERLKAETDQVPTVFISYCWADKETVDRIEEEICELAHVHRDTHNVKEGDSLSAFMKTIRKQDFVILVISDEYLKRRNCMYEVLQLLKDYEEGDNTFWDRVVPFVTATELYDANGRAKKSNYWAQVCTELETTISAMPVPATEMLVKEAKVLRYISMEIDKLLLHISDEMCDRDLDVFIGKLKDKLEKWAQYGNNPVKDVLLAAFRAGVIE